jgi:hypothetical protein
MTPVTILIEPDDFAGFHVIITQADAVLFITDSYLSPHDALAVAVAWIDDNHYLPESA